MRPRSLDEFLTKARVPYTVFRHPAAFAAQREAALSHVPGRCWAKTVVCLAGDKTVVCLAGDEPILAIVPAHLMVDLNRLAALTGGLPLRLATEQEFAGLWPECEVGAVSPFLSGRALRVFVDKTLVGEPEMVFSAGTHTDAIRMHYADFAELTRPTVGTFARRR